MQMSFALLGRRRFLPLFATQFLGAMNDNLFKNAMILFVTYNLYRDPRGAAAPTARSPRRSCRRQHTPHHPKGEQVNTSNRRARRSDPRGARVASAVGVHVISQWVMENELVEREYLDETLRRLAVEPEFQPKGWSAQEIAEFYRLVQCARAAHVDTDLRNMRVLRIRSAGHGLPGKAQATLSSGRLIDLTFKNSDSYGAVVFELLTPEMEAK